MKDEAEKRVIRSKRDIPSVEKLASDAEVAASFAGLARPYAIELIRSFLEREKAKIGGDFKGITYGELRSRLTAELEKALRFKIDRVINGTGILVHTNLGRAPLSESLFDNIKAHITGYGNLEFNVVTGKRGRRGELAEKYLALITEAEAGTIVNNNAAAIFIILNTLANRKKVLISRGELIQIGGGFRIPDIISKSGARLQEVGTTNITSYDDYASEMINKPGLILKVHRSNFAISGFMDEVSLKHLVGLGKANEIPVVNDLGSGVLIDTTDMAGAREPTVQQSVRDGADVTCFSGDKLLGGVQCGLIVGKREIIKRIKKNPIYRAVRVDKIIFSAIEQLLEYYLEGTWREDIKLWRLAGVKDSELYRRGQNILQEVNADGKIMLEGTQVRFGGGALPEIPIKSVALSFNSKLSPEKLAALFRGAHPPIIGRISDDRFMIDLKAIDENDIKVLTRIIKTFLRQI